MSEGKVSVLANDDQEFKRPDPAAPCRAKRVESMDRNEILEFSNPMNWSKSRKWTITAFSCMMGGMVGINALSIGTAAGVINEEFGISDEHFPNSYWTVTAWNIGAVVGPIVGVPLMENLGLRTIYLSSYILFFCFIIPQAVANSFATLIVTRFFTGFFGSIVQNAVAAVIGNLWGKGENWLPVTLFQYSYLFGFTIGPVIGAAILQYLQWRWIFYIELIVYGVLIPFAWILIKETRATKVLALLEQKHHICSESNCQDVDLAEEKPSILSSLYKATIRPAYLFFTEPVVFFFSLWSGLAVGNVFIGSQSIAQTFGEIYGFDDIQAGYVQAAMAIGETIGVVFCYLQGRMYYASAKRNKESPGLPIPESGLLWSIPISFIGFGGGLLIYGWTLYPGIPWIAPTIGIGLLGVAIMVVVQSGMAYVQDAYGLYGGSAIAAAGSFENLLSAFLPLSSQSMYTNLGFQWASSLLGFVAIALSFAPVVLYLKGPLIRKRSKFMQSA